MNSGYWALAKGQNSSGEWFGPTRYTVSAAARSEAQTKEHSLICTHQSYWIHRKIII